MNKPISAIDAIGPAIQRTRMMLFRPFDAGKWLILGFLTFLQALGGGERYGDLRFPMGSWRNGDWGWKPRHSFGWIFNQAIPRSGSAPSEGRGVSIFEGDAVDWAERLRDGTWWVTHHPVLTGGLVFFGALIVLAIVVLFTWLSSRATFCYIDCIANNRAEVVRPWTQHGRLADSYFFWRLVFSIVMIAVVAVFAIPLVLSIVSMANSGHDFDPWALLFGGGIMVTALPVLAILIISYSLVRVCLNDFVAPIQYVRRVSCAEAFRVLRGLIRANLGAFLLYFVMRLLIWLVLYFSLTVLGCVTCCILFCCWAIPVIGQTVLQPFHVFTRAFSLTFLQGFGPGFDVFPGLAPEPAPAGGAPGSPGAWGVSAGESISGDVPGGGTGGSNAEPGSGSADQRSVESDT